MAEEKGNFVTAFVKRSASINKKLNTSHNFASDGIVSQKVLNKPLKNYHRHDA
jgi:hypothetical protein